MTTRRTPARRRTAALLAAVPALVGLLLLAGCAANRHIGFPYPSEQLVYPESGALPTVHVGTITDMRPHAQRHGAGHFTGITYPADRNWELPVVQMYRQALLQDIDQTRLARPVPLPSEADYVLEAEIYSFSCRLERNAASYLLPPGAGMLTGAAWGDNGSDRLKRGLLLSVVAMGALPLPARQHAEVEVHLVLRDRQGRQVWEQTCVGDLDQTIHEPLTSRRDREWAERYLPVAVKRCNACLLGQLRQYLSTAP